MYSSTLSFPLYLRFDSGCSSSPLDARISEYDIHRLWNSSPVCFDFSWFTSSRCTMIVLILVPRPPALIRGTFDKICAGSNGCLAPLWLYVLHRREMGELRYEERLICDVSRGCIHRSETCLSSWIHIERLPRLVLREDITIQRLHYYYGFHSAHSTLTVSRERFIYFRSFLLKILMLKGLVTSLYARMVTMRW